MTALVFRATEMPSGELRPFVPIEMSYLCEQCGGVRHVVVTNALVDSGADRMVYPADSMPVDHGPSWDSLSFAGRAYHHGSRQAYEMRLWPVDVTVYGVPITTAVWLSAPESRPTYPVVGRTDLFAKFTVTFAWHLSPPAFTLEPAGGWSDDPRRAPIPFASLATTLQLQPGTGATQPGGSMRELVDGHADILELRRTADVPLLAAPNRHARRAAARKQ